MSTEHTPYEIFLSYSRKDNALPPHAPPEAKGWVTALREHILQDHRRFSTEPLRIFFDVSEIRDMDDWQHRILGALRRSKILLVCLSPDYFRSQYCRWEWDEYLRRRVHQLMGADSIATVYFVEVPGSGEQDNARWLASVTHGNFTDMRPWFPEGAAALQHEEVRRRRPRHRRPRPRRTGQDRTGGGLCAWLGRLLSRRPLGAGRRGEEGPAAAHRRTGPRARTPLSAHRRRAKRSRPAWPRRAGRTPALCPGPARQAPAREIVCELGGFTLAIEQVAVHLGLHPEIGPSAFLAGLRVKGLPSLDRLGQRADVQAQMLHQHKQLAVILEATLGLLDAPARTALQFAALLPPDSVPWPWLKTLVTARHPELVQFAPDEPDPWVATHRRLEGLRLLTPGDHRELARLHRLVAAHLQAGAAVPPANQSLLTELEQHLAARAWAIYRAPMLSELWELEVLLAVLPGFSARREVSRDLVNATVFLSEKVVGYRSLREAMSLVRPAHESLQRLAAADPSNAGWQRDLSVSNIKMGNILRAEGDLARALRAYSESRAVSQRLAAADASSALCQHDLWVSHLMVGDVLRVQGDLAGALRAYQQALVVMERLVAVDASSAEWQCGLGNSHDRIGNVLRVQGDLAGALAAYREALTVNQRLTAADPANANWQRSLSVSHNKLGDVLSAQGDSAGALLAYRESLAVSQRLVADDQSNARLQMDLSTFHARKGDVLRAQGNLAEALAAYRESLVRIHVSYVT